MGSQGALVAGEKLDVISTVFDGKQDIDMGMGMGIGWIRHGDGGKVHWD